MASASVNADEEIVGVRLPAVRARFPLLARHLSSLVGWSQFSMRCQRRECKASCALHGCTRTLASYSPCIPWPQLSSRRAATKCGPNVHGRRAPRLRHKYLLSFSQQTFRFILLSSGFTYAFSISQSSTLCLGGCSVPVFRVMFFLGFPSVPHGYSGRYYSKHPANARAWSGGYFRFSPFGPGHLCSITRSSPNSKVVRQKFNT